MSSKRAKRHIKNKVVKKSTRRLARAATTRPPVQHDITHSEQYVAGLLADAAAALNALTAAGVQVRLAHGALITEWGYVFRISRLPEPWAVRSRELLAMAPASFDDDF